MATNGTLTRNQKRLIPFLLKYRRIEEAAAAAGLGKRTVMRWLAESAELRAELAAAEGRAIDQAARQLVALADEAIDTLRQVMADREANQHVKVRAANSVLSHLLKLRELRNVEERLTRLEVTVYGNAKR